MTSTISFSILFSLLISRIGIVLHIKKSKHFEFKMSRSAPKQNEGNEEEINFDEAEDLQTGNGLIYNKVYEAAERFAGTYVGQYATEKLDRALKLIEDTAKWSLPHSNRDKNDANTPLERPLPWIPFIALILMLRMTRLSISIAGLFIGNAPLVASDVVYFIQTRRRKLRAIRIAGMREIRRKDLARGHETSGGIVSKLRSLLSVLVCQPGQGREEHMNKHFSQNSLEGASSAGQSETNAEKDNPSSKRRLAEDEDGSDLELTLDQIIDKYGEASSDNDSDFIPPNDELNEEDVSSQCTSSATSEDEDEEEKDNHRGKEQLKEDSNPGQDAHKTNGNRRSTNSLSSTENRATDSSVVIKENGEHFSKTSRPVPMPKPLKQEQVPAPIQEIKQEPIESDEDIFSNQQLQQHPIVLKGSTEPSQLQPQQAVVAQYDEKDNVSDGSKDKDIADADVENANTKENGSEILPEIDETSGSPTLNDYSEFYPTSILKNLNAVYLEKRGPAVVYQDEDNNSNRADTSNETHDTTSPINTSHQPAKGTNQYTGRHNKNNKFRGKRR